GAPALAVAVGGGGVDQGAARVDERGQLHGGLVLVGVAAPRHGAQREPGHAQTASSQRALFHERKTYRRPPTGIGEHRNRRGGAAGRRRCAPRVSPRAGPPPLPPAPPPPPRAPPTVG